VQSGEKRLADMTRALQRSHRALRRGLQQLFQLLLVELRVAGREMAARLAGGRDQETGGRS
jgi:hypothetical protein